MFEEAPAFLKDLEAHNDKAWFTENQGRFERTVREPALQFIRDANDWFDVAGIPLRGTPKKAGGSLGRIHRDLRFTPDKTPYNTHVMIHFDHAAGVKVGLRFDTDGVGLGAGLWAAPTPTLNKIRDAIVADPEAWQNVRADVELWGASLKTAPRGYDKQHPWVDDLRRKSYLATVDLAWEPFASDPLGCLQSSLPELLPFCEFVGEAIQ